MRGESGEARAARLLQTRVRRNYIVPIPLDGAVLLSVDVETAWAPVCITWKTYAALHRVENINHAERFHYARGQVWVASRCLAGCRRHVSLRAKHHVGPSPLRSRGFETPVSGGGARGVCLL